jgi:hypothetical protein
MLGLAGEAQLKFLASKMEMKTDRDLLSNAFLTRSVRPVEKKDVFFATLMRGALKSTNLNLDLSGRARTWEHRL